MSSYNTLYLSSYTYNFVSFYIYILIIQFWHYTSVNVCLSYRFIASLLWMLSSLFSFCHSILFFASPRALAFLATCCFVVDEVFFICPNLKIKRFQMFYTKSIFLCKYFLTFCIKHKFYLNVYNPENNYVMLWYISVKWTYILK